LTNDEINNTIFNKLV